MRVIYFRNMCAMFGPTVPGSGRRGTSSPEISAGASRPEPPAPAATPDYASLTEWLRDELRRRLVRTQLHPGDLLLEKSLAAEYGVSKTPVREALRMLVAEGWVQVLPRRGYAVTTMGFHDIREVMELRRIIEPEMAAAAAGCGDPEVLADLRALLAEHRQAHDPAEAVDAAHRFHRRIGLAARNRRAVRTLEILWLETARAHALLPPLVEYIRDDSEHAAHDRVLQAIDAGDARGAHDAMHDHLVEAEQAMVNAVLGGRSG